MIMLKENLRAALLMAIDVQKKIDEAAYPNINANGANYSAFCAGLQNVVNAINNDVPIKIQ